MPQFAQIVPTSIRLDVQAMQDDLKQILSLHNFNETGNLCLTHRPQESDPKQRVYYGSGTLPQGSDEFDFSEPNDVFRATYLFGVLTSMKQKWKLGRTRLMLLRSHRCYSMHRDGSRFRCHAAIVTNPHCFMTYQTGEMFHIPLDGFIYRMNVQPLHSAFNAGKTDRIHLLFEFSKREQAVVKLSETALQAR